MRQTLIALAAVALVTVSFSGCAPSAGMDSFGRGLSLQSQHRYEDAIAMYEEALAREPDNARYDVALKSAKAALAGKHVDSARSILNEGQVDFAKLNSSLDQIDKALALEPSNPVAQEMSNSVKTQMNVMVKRAEELYASATKAAELKAWPVAVESLTEITSFYPGYLDLATKLAQAKEEGCAFYIREAQALQAAEDYSSALKSLGTAQELQPDDQRVPGLMAHLNEQNTPQNYLAKAQAYVKSGECDLALNSIQKAKNLDPPRETLSGIDRLHKEAAAGLIKNVEQDLASKNLYNAYNSFVSTLRFDADAVNRPRVKDLRDRLVVAMLERAQAYEEINRFGNALVWQEKAQRLTDNNEVIQKTQALKEKVRQRVVKKIALMDFTSPTASQDAGRIVTDNLLSYLTRNSSGDLKILARDVLGTLLKEIEMGQAGLYDIESAKKGGKLKGTDVFIFGSVLAYDVEKNLDEGLKMVNAVVGTRTVPNPAFQEWQRRHSDPSEKERLNAPPQSIKEEINEIIKYKVATHKKTANVNVSFRVIDVEEGEVIITKTLKNKLEVSDTYSEGVEFAGIPYKPLVLPSDTELLEKVVESTIAELGYAVLSRFQNLQVLYSKSAENLKTKGNPEMVIERYMDAITAEEIKNSPSQITETAKSEIELQLKSISKEIPINDLTLEEKAVLQQAPQAKMPIALKLPPDPAVAERGADATAPVAPVAPQTTTTPVAAPSADMTEEVKPGPANPNDAAAASPATIPAAGTELIEPGTR